MQISSGSVIRRGCVRAVCEWHQLSNERHSSAWRHLAEFSVGWLQHHFSYTASIPKAYRLLFFVCWCFTSCEHLSSYQYGYRLVTVHIHDNLRVLSHWETRLPATWPDIPLSHITLTLSEPAWLGSDKYQIIRHWFVSIMVRTCEVRVPRSPKMRDGCSTHSAIPSGLLWEEGGCVGKGRRGCCEFRCIIQDGGSSVTSRSLVVKVISIYWVGNPKLIWKCENTWCTSYVLHCVHFIFKIYFTIQFTIQTM